MSKTNNFPRKTEQHCFLPEEQEHRTYMRLMVHPLQNCLSNCGNKYCHTDIIFKIISIQSFVILWHLQTQKEEVILYKIPPKSLTEPCSEKHLLWDSYLADHQCLKLHRFIRTVLKKLIFKHAGKEPKVHYFQLKTLQIPTIYF